MSVLYTNERVSIITPMFNAEPFLVECIESVLAQTYTNWEMVIVDDMSTDGSFSVAESYARRDVRIQVVRQSANIGVGQARNVGLQHASGRYIAFLDSDDMWLPDKLLQQVHFLQTQQVPLTYTAYERVDVHGGHLRTVRVPTQITYTDMLRMNYIACLTMCYDRNLVGEIVFPRVGHEDYVVWLSLIRRFGVVFGISECLARYRVRDVSLSGNKWKSAQYQWYVYRNIECLSFIRSCYYFVWYTALNVLKRM